MAETGGVDRFDAQRREWIARHQGWSMVQRRRAEQLGRRIRARQRERSSAAADPHDDTLLPPWWLRTAHSAGGQLEVTALSILVLVVPAGLLMGYGFKAIVVRLIPDTLRGYPIAALLCSAAGLGVLTVAGELLAWTPPYPLERTVESVWLCAQVVATPATAGVLGIAEGWWAIPASRQWFPRTPPRRPLSGADAAEILGGYDLTGPGLIDARRLPEPGERTR